MHPYWFGLAGTEKPISIPTMVTTEERNNALLNSFGNVTGEFVIVKIIILHLILIPCTWVRNSDQIC